jgi:hypothetical protein
LLEKLCPLASDKMSVDVPPSKPSRFGAPLVLSPVHWVRPELVAEVTLSDLDCRRAAAPRRL